ncbi:hypothetical protein [Marinimicrobium sp. C2-29]|uniref:hypothetical protein n=1 Tax=Marinimicrobium sp. C2-29 TaxID=3139825 RepID=UPI003139F359
MRWKHYITTAFLGLAVATPAALAQDDWDDWGDDEEAGASSDGSSVDDSSGDSSSGDSTWDTEAWGDDAWEEESGGFPLYGFVELGLGGRLSDSDYHDRLSLGEARLRLETDGNWKQIGYTAKGDFVYDEVIDEWDAEFRELTASLTLFEKVDVKAGRQVITWGTGDYVFLNDLFPKDWQAFFIGRDDAYLKAPSDSLRLSGYFEWANVELVWTPEFAPDTYPRGERLSLFNPATGGFIGKDQAFAAAEPDDDELALRVFRTIKSVEVALYGYDGYYKSPEAMSPEGFPTFTGLSALGASIRTPWGPGLFNAEVSHHESKADTAGTNPRIPNSQWRGLVGYEKELITRLTGSVQLYLEHNQDHSQRLAQSAHPEWEPEQNRTLVTTRLTWRDRRDYLTLSLFAFYSPSDEDMHLRPRLDYRFGDNLSLSTGFNLFWGKSDHSFFGQFEDNNNAYARVRYAF